ncbi:hypothetical protein HNR06_001837 [Nocardiopsis arvandica]|uniref:Uncharacterized protein n=1 Tax=Nocardiopsis sinuspersici TaxID=501010 RepID=A0A7Z0BI30_9ACTN|nr:hypothetical protein [Nocardiopsis sinuspersici]NYH52248.1 hypothetical protein [Nocardiopsis sinuspersici]
MRNGPLKNAEREFLKLDLDISDLVALIAPFVDDRPTTLLELCGVLLGRVPWILEHGLVRSGT